MAATHPRGKGIWIKRIMDCEQGDLEAIVALARQAAFSHVIVKIADGADPEPIDLRTGFDYAAELITRLTRAGIEAWGWHHIYGDTPVFKGILRTEYHLSEAERALQRISQLQGAGLQGFIVKADDHYEGIPERARKASQFSAIVRAGLGPLPIGLSSWKYPNSHRRFPWAEFRNHCDFDLPQVFWIGKQREAARQLEASLQRFARLEPALPYVATGPAFQQKKWQPLPDQLRAFLEKAIELGLPAANFWNWDYLSLTGDESDTQPDFREHWNVIAEFEWPEPAPDWTPHPEPVAVSTETTKATLELESAVQFSNVQPEVAFQLKDEPEPARPFHSDAELETAPEPEPDLSLELEIEDELPEWLQGLDEAFESEDESEPVRPFRSDAELETAPEPEPEFLTLELEIEDELPEWLQGLEEPAQSSTEEFTSSSAAPTALRRPQIASALEAVREAPAIAEADAVARFFTALQNGKPDEIVSLYGPGFSHASADRVERSREAVREFYAQLRDQIESATLVWEVVRRTRLSANVRWSARTKASQPLEGTESFHLSRSGQIIYHHTSFRIEAG